MPSPKPTIYFFYGEDTYSISKKINFWTEQFALKHGGDTNIETIEGQSLDPKEFGTNIQSLPFLAEKRLIIVKDLLSSSGKDNKENAEKQRIVAEILDDAPEFCVLVFTESKVPDKRKVLFKKLSKIAQVEEFPLPSPAQLTNWIIEETLSRKGKIGRVEAEFLSSQVGPNLWQLSNEIDKLISATKSNQEPSTQTAPTTQTTTHAIHQQPTPTDQSQTQITKSLIENLVTPSLGSSIFKLTDAIAAKNRKESLKIFKTLVDSGEELTMIFYMIVRHFRILIQAQFLTSKGSSPDLIARTIKQHPYVAMTAAKQSKNFTQDKLKKIYSHLLEIDKNFKTGKIKTSVDDSRELLLAIEQFIIRTI